MAVWSATICTRQLAAAANLAPPNFYLNSAAVFSVASSGLFFFFKENFFRLEVVTPAAVAEGKPGRPEPLALPVAPVKMLLFPAEARN